MIGVMVPSVFAQQYGMSLTATASEGGNIISVTGLTMANQPDVSITVQYPNGNIIALDQLTPNSNGNFSTQFNVSTWSDGIYQINSGQGTSLLYSLTLYVEVTNGMTVETSTSDSSIFSTQSDDDLAELSITGSAIEGSDTIEITGDTTRTNEDVVFTVTAPNGNLVSVTQVSPESNGDFTTNIFVELPLWSQDGEYTVTAQQGIDNSNFKDSVEFEVTNGFIGTQNVLPIKTERSVIIKNTNSYADYTIYDATLLEVQANSDRTSLTVLIDAEKDGSITINVPYDIILQGDHQVFLDGQNTNSYGWSTNVGNYHSIDVSFNAGTKKIEMVSSTIGGNENVLGNVLGCDRDKTKQPTVVLDPLGFNQVISGDTIVFTGKIFCPSGYIHPSVQVVIYENKFIDNDPILVTTYTNSNGEFSVPWIAKTSDDIDSEGTTIQAKYTAYPWGSSGMYYESISEKQIITIKRLLSEISLDPLPASAEIGEMLFFTGKLGLESGSTEGYIVYIKDEDPFDSDDLLATGYVESDGSFSANWIVTNTDEDRITDVYAVFEGADIYWRVTTCDNGMTYQRGGGCNYTIPLQITGEILPPAPPPPPAPKLDSDGDGIFDDNDQCVNSAETYNGYQDWDGCPDTVPPVPPTNIDSDGDGINDNFDSCPYVAETFNGYQDHDGCSDTIPKPIPKENLNGDEYMKLRYTHTLDKNPVVAIVPAPDSYEQVRKYIIPAQEGVMMWGNDLTREYGGDWNVDFIIIDPNSNKFSMKPDIIMNVVTRNDESGCGVDFAGIAYLQYSTDESGAWRPSSLPVNTVVCTTGVGFNYDTNRVSGIAAHEFIHAMGLGHTFNKNNDLMCSVESGVPTCDNTYNKSRTPSDFNLASVKKTYQADGWKNPNFKIYSNSEQFTAGQYNNFEYSPPDISTQVTPTPVTPTPVTPTPVTPTPVTPTPVTPTPVTPTPVTPTPVVPTPTLVTPTPTPVVPTPTLEPVVEQVVTCGTGTELVNGICQVVQTEEKSSKGGGCLIATATYGSELAPQVQQLRELRDNQLLQTESGTQFMGIFNDIYYSFSPTIADYERENPYFKEAVKLGITPMISSLSLMENAESESEVLSIGISVIMLNLGMYLGVPAIVIIGIRKIK